MRTPLDKLDIDDATRKLLNNGGVVDVEGILEVDPQKLATIVGSADLAKKLIDMAKRLLGSTAAPAAPTVLTTPSTPAPAPTPTRPTTTPPTGTSKAEGGEKPSGRKREPKKPK